MGRLLEELVGSVMYTLKLLDGEEIAYGIIRFMWCKYNGVFTFWFTSGRIL